MANGGILAIGWSIVIFFYLSTGISTAAVASPLARYPEEITLFQSGNGEYDTYRIPALAVTIQGTVLAFCEGRKNGLSDAGDIDVIYRRSPDGGETWEKQKTIWNDQANTCGNPCPVVDKETGTIWLLMTWNRGEDNERKIIEGESIDTRRIFVTCSRDDGQTWSHPVEITNSVKKTNWTWYATGPGGGIQLEHGIYAGRLIIPCDHMVAGQKKYFSHIVYSDDHGKTWNLGGVTPHPEVNECQAVELTGNRVLLNMRNYDRSNPSRQIAYSYNGGLTWKEQAFASSLIEPICQASIRRIQWPTGHKPGIILFSNPADTHKRINMTIRLSYDDGKTWPLQRTLYAGPSAYSDLAVLPGGDIGCLFEKGQKNPYETITLARFSIYWISRSASK